MSLEIRPLVPLILVLSLAGCGGTADRPTSRDGEAGESASDVAARVGDHVFSLADVDRRAKAMDATAYQALYDARKKALDALIVDHLLDAEARRRGIDRQTLIEQEVDAKTEQPTAEQVRVFYDKNEAAMRGRTFEQVSGQIRSFLVNQSRQSAMSTLIDSLREKQGVEVLLDPPRVPVTIAANDPTKGPSGAPVQILMFSEFQ